MANLSVTVNQITFRNPVLTAAGPNVRSGELMTAAINGGVGGVVAKTVSVVPAEDARPTIRRTSGRGLMNSETWSEVPVESYLADLKAAATAAQEAENRERGGTSQSAATGQGEPDGTAPGLGEPASSGQGPIPLIPSIGYKPEEVARLGKLLASEIKPAAIEFSTHYTGKSHEPLIDVARALREAVNVPIWMKVSPTVPGIEDLVVAAEPYVDAFVAINSYGPVLDFDPGDPVKMLGTPDGSGWLSGSPIRTIALNIVYRIAHAQSKPVIGVGGIESGLDAIKFLMAGAGAVQVCTAAIRRGNDVYGKIAREIGDWLDQHGYRAVSELVGLYRPERSAASHPAMHVEPENCTGCKACLSQCIHGAIQWNEIDEQAYILPEACIGCGFCQDACRYDAMHLKEMKK